MCFKNNPFWHTEPETSSKAPRIRNSLSSKSYACSKTKFVPIGKNHPFEKIKRKIYKTQYI